MILVINGTNRPQNSTQVISMHCYNYLLNQYSGEVKYLTLEEISNNILHNGMYDKEMQHPNLKKLQDDLLIPAKNWLIISPEYNGSFPGVLKVFIDALSTSNRDETFAGKYFGLIGTSDGRAGNLRGIEHLGSLLNYLKVTIYHNKLPISLVNQVVQGGTLNENTCLTLKKYLDDFLHWIK